MDDAFKTDVMAEFAALNIAVIYALRAAVSAGGHDPDKLRHAILEAGLRDLDSMHYGSVPGAMRAEFVENARRRYSNLMLTALPA
jgi:hypothetical protein